MKSVSAILIFTVLVQYATAQDPRAIGIRLDRGIEEEGRSTYLREDSNFSIAVYGPTEPRQVYRILGIDRKFAIREFTALLSQFYEAFPKDAKTKFGKPIPVPNILYTHGVWMEHTEAGPELVAKLSRKHGVALYSVTITPGYNVPAPPAEFTELTYELRCIAYYQKRLRDAVSKADKKGEQDGARQPATAPNSKSADKEKRKPESKRRSQ